MLILFESQLLLLVGLCRPLMMDARDMRDADLLDDRLRLLLLLLLLLVCRLAAETVDDVSDGTVS